MGNGFKSPLCSFIGEGWLEEPDGGKTQNAVKPQFNKRLRFCCDFSQRAEVPLNQNYIGGKEVKVHFSRRRGKLSR